MFNKITINMPPQINVFIWKNLYRDKNIVFIKLYNDSKKFSFFLELKANFILYDKESNSITVEKQTLNKDYIKFEKNLMNFFKSWEFYFFSKIKFKGKGFRIRYLKKLKLVKFFFGRSHKTFILFKNVYLKRINKYKFIVKNIEKTVVIRNRRMAVNIKPLNFYTLRGLRASKQIVFKRKGKKGTYI